MDVSFRGGSFADAPTYNYSQLLFTSNYYLHSNYLFTPPFFLPVFGDGVRIRDQKHNFLEFPESVQKMVGSMLKIGQFFDHLNFGKYEPGH